MPRTPGAGDDEPELLRALFESAPDAIVIADGAGRIRLVNQRTETLLGWTGDELIGQPIEMLIPERFRGAHPGHWLGYFQDRRTRPMGLELLAVRKDGGELPAEISLSPIVTDEGTQVIAAIRDVGPRRKVAAVFRGLLESAPDAIVMVDPTGTMVLVNSQTERIFGYPRAELLGQPIELLIPSRVHDRHRRHREDYARDPRVRAMGSGLDLYGRRKDGSELPVEISLSPLVTDEGTLISSSIRDVTERKAAEERYRLLVDGVMDYAVTMFDPEGRLASWNEGAERIHGYRPDEILGRHVAQLYPADDAARGAPKADLESAARDGRWEREGWRTRKNGSRFWANVILTALRDPAGRLRGYSKVVRDITERWKAEELFRGLLEAAPDAIVIVDRVGRIMLVNAQTEALFGYARAELVGREVELLVPERHRGEHTGVRATYQVHPRTRAMGAGLELHGRRKDGSEFPAEISLSPLVTSDGVVVSAAIRDVSARQITERALVLANRELEAFSYSVAHDLRAPLRGMSGFAQVLLEDHAAKLDADAIGCLHEIQTNARTLGALIDALLSLARVSRSDLRLTTVDLGALARAATAQLAAAEPGRAVELVVADRLEARLDPHLARLLIANLVGNAWKFTGRAAAPRIEVGVATVNGARAFFVRDNGAGFEMAYAGKLFAPFQRLHTEGEFPGTGIGLATAQRIVQRHGGRIWAEALVGAGATFYFTLPDVERRLP